MAENSMPPSRDETETLRSRVAELESLLREEQAKCQAAEDVAGSTGVDSNAYAGDAVVETPTSEQRIRAEIERRERVELALEDSEALYHSLVEHLPISVYRIDMDTRITFGNSAYLKDIGRSLEDLLGKTVFDLFPEAEARKYDADDQKVLESDQPFHTVEEHYVRGKRLYVEVLKCPVHDHEGRLVGVQGLYWDVTARKQAEEQLRKTMIELEQSNKELQQFAGVASHDMHAPLRRIVTLSAMLQDQYANQFDTNGRELLEFIVASAEHMQELIDDLLAHSRVGTSQNPLEAVECASTVMKAQSNLAVLIDETGAEIQVGRLPTVMANKVELVQLFQNLMGNAIKYRSDATPRVDVSAEAQCGEWLFRVKDNGIGIPPEHRKKIFEAFKRLHGEDKYPGTGIGLATCKKIVERLDGKIWVESHEGEGSVFVFTLPRRGLSETESIGTPQ